MGKRWTKISTKEAREAAFADMRESYKKEGKSIITFDVRRAFQILERAHEIALKYVQYYTRPQTFEDAQTIVDLV